MNKPALNIKTLGGLDIADASCRPVALATRKARALLIYLAMSPGLPRSREHLAGVFWDRSAEEQARASLRQTLSGLKKALPNAGVLILDADTASIDPRQVGVDALQFERLADSRSLESLELAADLYAGDFLAGFSLREETFEQWQTTERHRLRERAIQVLSALLEHYESQGALSRAAEMALRSLAVDPLQEDQHRALMRLCARQGRHTAALEQYERCREVLDRELGVAPGAETDRLYRSILQQRFEPHYTLGTGHPEPEAAASASRRSEQPSIAVLPFANMSGDPEQEYFSDGITEDIITELSKFRSLEVIARSSSFAYKNKPTNVRTVGRELGVQYVVEGSVRRAQDRIRITAQLVETDSGAHVWAQRYDRQLEDVFELQDEVTQTIVATVGGRLQDHRIRLPYRKHPEGMNAYDLILRAQAQHYRVLKASNDAARELLAQALTIDPDNPRAHSLLGAVELLDYTSGWTASPREALARAQEHGRKSVRLDPSDSLAHARLGETLIHFGLYKESKHHFDKALELNPNDSEARALYAIYYSAIGEPGQALAQLDIVRKIDPFERVWVPWLRGDALFLAGRYAEAIDNFEQVAEPINDLRATLAACHAKTGDLDTARRLLTEFLATAREEMPNFPGTRYTDWAGWRYSADHVDEQNHQRFMEAVREAWPD